MASDELDELITELWETASLEPQRKRDRPCPECGQDELIGEPTAPPAYLAGSMRRTLERYIELSR